MKRAYLALPLAVVMAAASAQNIKPPIANYWMSVETATGMNMPGMGGFGGMIAGAMGGSQMQGGKRMALQLGSQRGATEPRADHAIPPGMAMGSSLPLVGSTREPTERSERRNPYQQLPERNARLLIYWGCGATARPGQPVIIDTANMRQGGAGLAGRTVARGTPPAATNSRGYADWPNQQDSKAVPDSASLVGDHAVKGNFTPDIRFALSQDFLDRVQLATSDQAGAVRMQWKGIAGATGYHAMVMASQGNDTVIWSSSEVQEMGMGLMDYISPVEVARLVRERVILPPHTTECVVPMEVAKSGGGMINFIAYGPETNFAHPPRPANASTPWAPEWAVKVRYKSTAMAMLGGEGEARAGAADQTVRGQPDASSDESAGAKPQDSAPRSPVKEGINILRGIFGR